MARTVLVSGAARGIGRAVRELFAARGWNVAALDLDGLNLDVLDMEPGGFLPLQGDVADPEVAARAVARTVEAFGSLDALVNNAAIQPVLDLADTPPEEWDRVLGVNLKGPYLLVRAAREHLRASAGAVVNVSSVHALATSPGLGAYGVSKGGLAAMTRTLALELAPDKVRVNAVLPGAVDTDMLRRGLARESDPDVDPESALAGLCGRTPLGRVGEPWEIAEAVYFLADNERSAFITGQCLAVDGGALARLGTE